MKTKLDKNGIWTAHMSDIHQSENYVTEIQSIDDAARVLVIQGDWMQCHKDKRPSKGKIKGLPGVDNGFGETVQKWALEAAAYINHGTKIEKGQPPVEFKTIPSGFLNIESQNYEEMHKFFRKVSDDTLWRLEDITITAQKRKIETVLFPGHDNAYNFWIKEMFSDIRSLKEAAEYVESGVNTFEGIPYMRGVYFAHVDGIGIFEKRILKKIDLDKETEVLISPLYALPDTKRLLREFIGTATPEAYQKDKATEKELTRKLAEGYNSIIGKTPYLVLCSHEGPKEISDVVHELAFKAGDLDKPEKGKATENRAMYEAMFATPNDTDTKVIWVYGNDGFPIAHTQDIIYGAGKVPITVHHLAEMDVKGDPMSNRGGVSYINHKTGQIITPQQYREM